MSLVLKPVNPFESRSIRINPNHKTKCTAAQSHIFALKFTLVAALALMASLLAPLATAPAYAQALDFTLEDLDGESHSLSEYLEDGPVYVSFYAMWCQPCLLKLRNLAPLYEKHKEKGFTFLVINIDTPNSLSRVEAYWRSQRYEMPMLLDPDSRVFEKLNGSRLPYALMIGQDGKIVQTDTGYLPGDEVKIEEKILGLIGDER